MALIFCILAKQIEVQEKETSKKAIKHDRNIKIKLVCHNDIR